MQNHSSIIREALTFAKKQLEGNDSSHDWYHAERVRKLAKGIATCEGISDTEMIELAAILHDVGDHKYTDGNSQTFAVKQFLESVKYDQSKIEQIVYIIENMSYSCDLGKNKQDDNLQLCIVKDADRLDAIGAVGIARAFAYGSRVGAPFYDPKVPPQRNMTKESYMQNQKSSSHPTINHFYEKLLLLKDKMYTTTAKKIAEGRHMFMLEYLKQFCKELE